MSFPLRCPLSSFETMSLFTTVLPLLPLWIATRMWSTMVLFHSFSLAGVLGGVAVWHSQQVDKHGNKLFDAVMVTEAAPSAFSNLLSRVKKKWGKRMPINRRLVHRAQAEGCVIAAEALQAADWDEVVRS